jgi:formylglycine-generating enzyme required for sulfatase activity
MSGNVWEWVSDWYGAEYYSISPTVDPIGPLNGTYRVGRGGGFGTVVDAAYLRVSFRNDRYPSDSRDNVYLGFRCAQDCVPDCTLRECGDDGCGGSCGVCVGGTCESGLCAETPKILIPAGSFWMGCNVAVDGDCGAEESPYHEVTLSGYYMDKTEVTVAAYGECVTAGSCTAPSTGGTCTWGVTGHEQHPVNCIDWFQSEAYCEWAGKQLPTEAQWEKAARGTDGRKYPWGNQAATCDHAVKFGCGGPGGAQTVCSKSPAGDSPYGLCDMAGNAPEWVSDWYSETYYSVSPDTDPVGPASGSYRVFRGGGFDFIGDFYFRTSFRSSNFALDTVNIVMGFRCATNVP